MTDVVYLEQALELLLIFIFFQCILVELLYSRRRCLL